MFSVFSICLSVSYNTGVPLTCIFRNNVFSEAAPRRVRYRIAPSGARGVPIHHHSKLFSVK